MDNQSCSYLLQSFIRWGPVLLPLLVFLLVLRIMGRKNLKKMDDAYAKSWKNQEEIIAILKEIRDALKR